MKSMQADLYLVSLIFEQVVHEKPRAYLLRYLRQSSKSAMKQAREVGDCEVGAQARGRWFLFAC